jgi:hypothetical protein
MANNTEMSTISARLLHNLRPLATIFIEDSGSTPPTVSKVTLPVGLPEQPLQTEDKTRC